MDAGDASGFVSGAAIFIVDERRIILGWNEAAERLTGIRAEEAIGEPCWRVVGGEDDAGHLVCHDRCARSRLFRERRPVPTLELRFGAAGGGRRVTVDAVAVPNGTRPVFINVMREAPVIEAPPAPPGPRPHLTARQAEILRLLAEGRPAKTVAERLGLMETTVRNHIRAVLVELGAHSQLEAVARARSLGLL